MFAHAVIISSKSSCLDCIHYARYCMRFASKAIIYLNEERGRAARNNFLTVELAHVVLYRHNYNYTEVHYYLNCLE